MSVITFEWYFDLVVILIKKTKSKKIRPENSKRKSVRHWHHWKNCECVRSSIFIKCIHKL